MTHILLEVNIEKEDPVWRSIYVYVWVGSFMDEEETMVSLSMCVYAWTPRNVY
jgi:hypothetical protein